MGDKTFFIAALLAARANKLLTFVGCAGALAVMTVISVAIGQVHRHRAPAPPRLRAPSRPPLQVFHSVPPSLTRGLPLDDYVAIASFLYFGVKCLLDAQDVEVDGAGIDEERDEVSDSHPHLDPIPNLPSRIARPATRQAEKTLSKAGTDAKQGWAFVAEACTLTIAAEVGDRSQIATIALSAASNPFGVAAGATVGHCAATGLAVLGGAFISKYLSERVIGRVGGVLFLAFALTTAIGLF